MANLWAQRCGVEIRGRSRKLTAINYRTTRKRAPRARPCSRGPTSTISTGGQATPPVTRFRCFTRTTRSCRALSDTADEQALSLSKKLRHESRQEQGSCRATCVPLDSESGEKVKRPAWKREGFATRVIKASESV